jgi:phage-related protein
MNKFEVLFLTEARLFLKTLDEKTQSKVILNIDKSKVKNDNTLFKKLNNEIWEFRTLYNSKQIRIFAFWDKTGEIEKLVIATHGIFKKTGKTPSKEIEKAENSRKLYFELKNKQNGK